MRRLFIAIAAPLIALTINSCKKDVEGEANLLSGTWIKGTNTGDTIYFIKNNGKNVMRYNPSLNPAFSTSNETEYSYNNGKLALKNVVAGQNNFYPIESFNWKQEGREFEVLGYQIFPFMSSTVTRFTYRKIK